MPKRSWWVAAACAGTAVFAAPVAMADVPTFTQDKASGADECAANRYCLYTEPSFNNNDSTWMWTMKSSQPDLRRGRDANNYAESVVNNTDVPITLYENFYTGVCVTLESGAVIDDLDDYGLRNEVTSVRMGSLYTCPSWGAVAHQ